VGYGWYPRRRGILEHLEQGTITLLDDAVHDFLCLTADHRTGVTWVSAEKIHVLAGAGISLRAIQRSLAKLEVLEWVKRFRVHGKRGNYATLIGRYFVRDASLRWWSVNLSRTNDWRNVQFDPVTDASFVRNAAGKGGDTGDGTEASPIQEGRIQTEDLRGVDVERDSKCEGDVASSPFEGFDLPKDRKLQLSGSLTDSLFIDNQRLTPGERAALKTLGPVWKQSWERITRGEMKCDDWIEEALECLKKKRILYPKVLELRMHELRDGRLTA
jgi:hypothetical protein